MESLFTLMTFLTGRYSNLSLPPFKLEVRSEVRLQFLLIGAIKIKVSGPNDARGVPKNPCVMYWFQF